MVDMTAWLHAQVQTEYDKGMEASGIYSDELYSFRQGRSTAQVLANALHVAEMTLRQQRASRAAG